MIIYPKSPINLLSTTEFAKMTLMVPVDINQLRSRFYWQDNSKFIPTILHLASNIPEVAIHEGFFLSRLYNVMFTKIIGTSVDFKHSCCWTHINDEDPHKQSSTRIRSETFEVEKTLFYIKEGLNLIVKVHYIQLKDSVLRIYYAHYNS